MYRLHGAEYMVVVEIHWGPGPRGARMVSWTGVHGWSRPAALRPSSHLTCLRVHEWHRQQSTFDIPVFLSRNYERERAYSWSLYKTKMARHDVLVFVVAVSHNIPAVFFLLLSSGENKSGARTDWMCEVQDRSMRWFDIYWTLERGVWKKEKRRRRKMLQLTITATTTTRHMIIFVIPSPPAS